MARNGYLTQAEFRRWADTVDKSLAVLTVKGDDYATQLAVLKDRLVQRDATKHIIGGIVAAVVATLVGYFMHRGGI